MLAFELAIYLRMHTAGRLTNSPVPTIMPRYGNPCFQVIAAFCRAVWDIKCDGNPIDFDAKLIGDNVNALKGVILTEWPTG